MGPRSALRCAPRPSASPRSAQVLLAALGAGEAVYRAFDGRLKLLRPGEILVLESELPVDVRIGDGGRLSALVAPAHMLAPRFVARERLRGGALRAHAGGVAVLLHQLLKGLTEPERAPLGAGALVDAVGGLVSAVLEDCWAQERDDGQAMRKLRMEQINQHIRRNFADPELSPGDVAEALGLSRRYVHKLYAQEGRSFRQDLIGLRIEACLRAFTDEQQAGKTIADIAYAAGYTDISQFNRHFRKLKGDTPSNVRRALVDTLGRKGGRRASARGTGAARR
ncbi:helix-turn-helix domain-containing protein [Caulobacter sp. KR2-114]|uniref:helix-turn-helix domain-containing protein n=1 Tax=Caulobacter sp. KR2-114 TaxID=3400912 RepID=UPI003BFEDBDE